MSYVQTQGIENIYGHVYVYTRRIRNTLYHHKLAHGLRIWMCSFVIVWCVWHIARRLIVLQYKILSNCFVSFHASIYFYPFSVLSLTWVASTFTICTLLRALNFEMLFIYRFFVSTQTFLTLCHLLLTFVANNLKRKNLCFAALFILFWNVRRPSRVSNKCRDSHFAEQQFIIFAAKTAVHSTSSKILQKINEKRVRDDWWPLRTENIASAEDNNKSVGVKHYLCWMSVHFFNQNITELRTIFLYQTKFTKENVLKEILIFECLVFSLIFYFLLSILKYYCNWYQKPKQIIEFGKGNSSC